MAKRIFQVVNDGNGYCGLVSISALTGLTTTEAARIIRKHTGRACVKAVSTGNVFQVLRVAGLLSFGDRKHNGLTLAQLIDTIGTKNENPFLVFFHDHCVVVYRGSVICTQTGGKRAAIATSNYRNRRIESAWNIRGAVDRKALDAALPKPNALPKSETQYKRKLMKLTEAHNLELDFTYNDDDRPKVPSTIWIFWPHEGGIFDGVDPWEDEHFAHSYQEAVEKIEETIRDHKTEKATA